MQVEADGPRFPHLRPLLLGTVHITCDPKPANKSPWGCPSGSQQDLSDHLPLLKSIIWGLWPSKSRDGGVADNRTMESSYPTRWHLPLPPPPAHSTSARLELIERRGCKGFRAPGFSKHGPKTSFLAPGHLLTYFSWLALQGKSSLENPIIICLQRIREEIATFCGRIFSSVKINVQVSAGNNATSFSGVVCHFC